MRFEFVTRGGVKAKGEPHALERLMRRAWVRVGAKTKKGCMEMSEKEALITG